MSIAVFLIALVIEREELSPDVVLLLLTAASIAIARAARVLPPRRVSGPDRIPPDRPAAPLVAVMFAGIGAFFFVNSLYFVIARRATHPSGDGSLNSSEVFLGVFSELVGFVMLVWGDRMIRPAVKQDLGFSLVRLPRGLGRGVIGAAIVLPPLYLLAQIVDMVYRGLNYRHPTEHPLLHTLGERPGAMVMATIIVGACVVAPLAEELLFRGHVQTLLRRFFYRLSVPRLAAPPVGFTVITAEPQAAPAPLPALPAPPRPNAWQTWSAILVTSLLFALIHPTWTFPMIFALAICLGYAYERTGNLWVSIAIHAAFNTASTALFLWGPLPR